jgi:beige protein homolog 1
VKKLLDALKGETFHEAVFPDFLKAFKSLVNGSMSAEVLRSLALYITYAMNKTIPSSARSLKTKKSTTSLQRKATISAARATSSPSDRLGIQRNRAAADVPRAELGVKVLEMYTDILCDPKSTSVLRKFAKTVTNKVFSYIILASMMLLYFLC